MSACGCCTDWDGIIWTACASHAVQYDTFQYRVSRVLDAEMDDVVRELAGRQPRRIERKAGAVGDFAVNRASGSRTP